MRICFLRHGVAVDAEDPQCPADSERWLTERGIRRTRAAVGGLAALGVAPDRILTSPYRRARETAEIVAEALSAPVVECPVLVPGGDGAAIVRAALDAGVDEVVCVGHLPSLGWAIAAALGGGDFSLGKAGGALVEVVDLGASQLHWLLPPKALRALGS